MILLRTFISFLPFSVCLMWFAMFVLQIHKNDAAKRWLTVFLAVCAVLYFCHALFFTVGQTNTQNAIWVLCSLSVYPIYYIYICHLCSSKVSKGLITLLLLPGIVVALANLLFPGTATDTMRKVLNIMQIVPVCFFGYKKLVRFDRQLDEVYADCEGRDTSAVRHLLIAFVLMSILSTVANAIGKQYVSANLPLLCIAFTLFAILLFALSHIGYTRQFTIEQFEADTRDEAATYSTQGAAEQKDEMTMLGKKIEQLMTERKFYLTRNLQIGDVAREVGSCRTYVSNYVNQTQHTSFSIYINTLRIEHAKQLMLENREIKMQQIYDLSGFTSETSFYRNFYKVEGMSPAEWLKKQR